MCVCVDMVTVYNDDQWNSNSKFEIVLTQV
jgi:hypothetical protein